MTERSKSMKNWAKVNGFDNYEADDDGNIRKVDAGRLLTYGIDTTGAKTVRLIKDGNLIRENSTK